MLQLQTSSNHALLPNLPGWKASMWHSTKPTDTHQSLKLPNSTSHLANANMQEYNAYMMAQQRNNKQMSPRRLNISTLRPSLTTRLGASPRCTRYDASEHFYCSFTWDHTLHFWHVRVYESYASRLPIHHCWLPMTQLSSCLIQAVMRKSWNGQAVFYPH